MQNSGPSGSLFLSRKALASSTPCRFIPAHRQLFLLLDDNYFSRSTTITPDLFGGRVAPPRAGGEARPHFGFFSSFVLREKQQTGGGGKVENLLLVFHFSFRPSSPELWKCGNLACLWRDFQGARGKRGKPAFGFPRFPQPRHFHSSLRFRFGSTGNSLDASSNPLHLAFRLLFLLGLLHSIARNVQFNNHAVVHQSVDRRRRHHRVLENPLPF